VFKPALRLQAIELRLTDMAREAAPDRAVSVQARDEGGVQRARIAIAGPHDAALAGRLQAALAAVAVPVEIAFG